MINKLITFNFRKPRPARIEERGILKLRFFFGVSLHEISHII